MESETGKNKAIIVTILCMFAIHSNLKVPNQEQEASITIQNSKLLNKANYLLAEIRRLQTIPSGTTGF